jgi:hypothetical protein
MGNSTFTPFLLVRRRAQPGDPVMQAVDPRSLTHEELLEVVVDAAEEEEHIAIVRGDRDDGGLSLVCAEMVERLQQDPEPAADSDRPPWVSCPHCGRQG